MLNAEPRGGAQPQSATQVAKAAANAWRRESDLVLIDVSLLLDARFPGALQLLEVELSVPPQRSSFFLLLDDVRLLQEQLADHSGEIGFVGLRHGLRIIRPLPSGQRLYINTDTEALMTEELTTKQQKILNF